MIDHLSTYASDFARTRAFYAAAFAPFGYGVRAEFVTTWDEAFPERRCCAFGIDRPVFWVIETRLQVTPRHVAFSAPDRATVDAFYAAALFAGGSDNGPPGVRRQYHDNYYGAFVLDPDGNNTEAVCHLP